jgi:hypothetical protein
VRERPRSARAPVAGRSRVVFDIRISDDESDDVLASAASGDQDQVHLPRVRYRLSRSDVVHVRVASRVHGTGCLIEVVDA